MARCLCAVLVLLVCGVAGGIGVKRGELGISSPVSGQEVRAGSDLLVKYEFDAGESGGSCSVLLLLNGRVERTVASCSSSLALSHDLLTLGENTLEIVLQGDATKTYPEHTIPFTVVAPRSWEELDAQQASSVASCQMKSVERVETTFPPEEGDDGGCPFTGGCLHEVDGTCLLFDDPSPDTTRRIPRILHWVPPHCQHGCITWVCPCLQPLRRARCIALQGDGRSAYRPGFEPNRFVSSR